MYCFVADLARRRFSSTISLEAYLLNLRALAREHCAQQALTLEEFVRILDAAFEPPGSPEEPPARGDDGYKRWDARIREQIRDLREMDHSGALANEYRYFGIDAPSGSRWYNFDPCTFLECAVAGAFGGWREGDETGRSYVPGQVAVLDEAGSLTTMDPRDIDDPTVSIPEISWDDFQEFIDAGQWYE